MGEGLGVDQAGVFTDMKGEVGDEGSVGEERDKEDGIRDQPEGRDTVDMMLVEMTSYLRTGKKGRRRRNEGFGRRGLHANWRRRSSRKRRVILWKRGRRSSEIERGGYDSWGNGMRNRPQFG
jgi:hypothetical protein